MMTENAPLSRIALWYPNAAFRWSLILTPAFGAWIHAENWSALGKDKEANHSMVWFYAMLIIDLWIIIFQPVGFGIILVWVMNNIWYASLAKTQMTYVEEELGNEYERKRWRQPLAFATLCFIFFVTFKIDLIYQVCR